MAKLVFLNKNEVSNKLRVRTQYRALKTWLAISVGLNLSLAIILMITTLYRK